ncbi:MAG TPA: DinB family protein [Candidatus Acidoferrum sp.]|nr:DinB family protein [Candidatus Acidoferrum sp.]
MTWKCGSIPSMAILAATFAAGSAWAQSAPATSAQEPAKLAPATNPVSSAVKAQLPRFSKNMVGAAEAMPAEKYNFKPTPEMNSFAHLVMHIAQSNNGLCSKISDSPAPEAKLADTDPKDKLVAGLKASFDYCASALEKVDDSKLGDQMMLFGNRPFSRAAVLIILSDDWYDHYGAQATYLRLNGILPPTAQPAPK